MSDGDNDKMTNALKNGVWKKALKTLVASVTSVLIVNFSDPKGVTFSKEWFTHVFIAVAILTIVNEAKYWKDWAESDNGVNNNGN